MDLYLLHETASGYALFLRKEFDEIGQASLDNAVLAQLEEAKSFRKLVELKSFHPFLTAEEALEEISAISNGECSGGLQEFLATNVPKVKKSKDAGYKIGILDSKLAEAVKELGYPVTLAQSAKELIRACRTHFARAVDTITDAELDRARCGLGHAFSRNKLKFDTNRQDKPIINAIAVIDGLDKNINTFAMRVREWYGWHFPELAKIVTDNIVYAKLSKLIGIRDEFDFDASAESLAEVCGSEEVAAEIKKAAMHTMGQDMEEMDMTNIHHFADQVVKLSEMRAQLQQYLKGKMDVVAPNLASLIGETIGARLISHAGSLTNLAKAPASTIQILGAEKALFRALKAKGNTPKYGLIFHSTFIGRAQPQSKGRISRFLANKCSLATRIDCFADSQSSGIFGKHMRDQVEERLEYLQNGTKPQRNIEVMRMAAQEAAENEPAVEETPKKEKKAKKAAVVVEEDVEMVSTEKKKKKKNREEEAEEASPVKKSKKNKHE
jgi:nucleolar protein 56